MQGRDRRGVLARGIEGVWRVKVSQLTRAGFVPRVSVGVAAAMLLGAPVHSANRAH